MSRPARPGCGTATAISEPWCLASTNQFAVAPSGAVFTTMDFNTGLNGFFVTSDPATFEVHVDFFFPWWGIAVLRPGLYLWSHQVQIFRNASDTGQRTAFMQYIGQGVSGTTSGPPQESSWLRNIDRQYFNFSAGPGAYVYDMFIDVVQNVNVTAPPGTHRPRTIQARHTSAGNADIYANLFVRRIDNYSTSSIV